MYFLFKPATVHTYFARNILSHDKHSSEIYFQLASHKYLHFSSCKYLNLQSFVKVDRFGKEIMFRYYV